MLWLAALLASGEALAEELPPVYRGALGSSFYTTTTVSGSGGARVVKGSLDLDLWPRRRPLVDDGSTPLALQVFVQRPDELSLSVKGGADLYRLGGTEKDLALSLRAGLWLSSVFLGGSLLVKQFELPGANRGGRAIDGIYVTFKDPDVGLTLIAPGLHLRVRLASPVELYLSYRPWVQLYGSGSKPSLQLLELTAGVRWVAGRNAAFFDLAGYHLPASGFGGYLFVEVFPIRPLGLFASFRYEDGAVFINTDRSYQSGTAITGTGLWVSRTVEVVSSLEARFLTSHETGSTSWDFGGRLEVLWRFR